MLSSSSWVSSFAVNGRPWIHIISIIIIIITIIMLFVIALHCISFLALYQSTLEVYGTPRGVEVHTTTRYINQRFTYLLTYLLTCIVLFCCTVYYCLFSFLIFSLLATSSIKLNLNLNHHLSAAHPEYTHASSHSSPENNHVWGPRPTATTDSCWLFNTVSWW